MQKTEVFGDIRIKDESHGIRFMFASLKSVQLNFKRSR